MRRQHCPPEHDERAWVVADRCDPDIHQRIEAAESAARTWLVQVGQALARRRIGPVVFPATTGRATAASGVIIDPTLVYLLLASARRGDDPTNAIYIGAFTQDLTSWWRGVAGFYLPYCTTCRPDIDTTLHHIFDWLPQDATVREPHQLPEGLRPGPGWFDDRLIVGVHMTASIPATEWKLWMPETPLETLQSALVRVGHLDATLDNLIFTAQASEGIPDMARFLKPDPSDQGVVLSFRTGDESELVQLAGGLRSNLRGGALIESQMPTGLSRRRLPTTWGVVSYPSNSGVRAGLTRNIREAVRTARLLATGSIRVQYWPPKPGILNWGDLRGLERDANSGGGACP